MPRSVEPSPPILTYQTPPQLADNSLAWVERPDGLWIRLPPPSRWRLVGWAIVKLVSALLLLLTAVASGWSLAPPFSRNVDPDAELFVLFIVCGAGLVAALSIENLWRVARRSHEPASVSLTDDALIVHSPHSRRLRRLAVGKREIVDLSVCVMTSAGGGSYASLRVELTHGRIEEIELRSSVAGFAVDLEKMLRTQLGLRLRADRC